MQVVIVANGSGNLSEKFCHIAQMADTIIAADGGANLCAEAGCMPHILIGDLDSIDSDLLVEYQQQAIEILRYPTRKDATDLELALDLAMSRGAVKIDLFGAIGGRLDMSLSNLMLASQEKYSNIKVSIHDHSNRIQILHPGNHDVDAESGERVSLLPIVGDVHSITLEGVEYPLADEPLNFGSSRGLSNVVIGEGAKLFFTKGVLAVICSDQNEILKEL